MSLAANFKELGQDMIRSQKHRSKHLNHLEKSINELLRKLQQDRTSETESIRVWLAADRAKRLAEVRELLNSYETDRKKAEIIWEKTLKILDKIRKEYAYH